MRKFRKISNIVKFSQKFRFWSNIRKNVYFGQIDKKNFDFGKNFRKILILVKMFENFHLFKNFENFSEIFVKISILVKFSKNFDFGQNLRKFRKISIWSTFANSYQNCRFLWKIFKKIRFWSNFRKNSIMVKIWESFENFRFWSNFRNILNAVESFQRFQFFRKFRF